MCTTITAAKMVKGIPCDLRERKPSLSRVEERREANKFNIVIGIDEAGRGPLCGPVVAAACIIPDYDGLTIDGIIDSKKVTAESEREQIYKDLTLDGRIMWYASVVSNVEIDEINILQASLTAMKLAAEGLLEKYRLLDTATYIALIDGNKIPMDMPVTSKCIIKGDSHIYSIAAASIIAKVTRDRIMMDLDQKYPMYGLARHKGYPTASHRSALYEHGPCEIYRMTYAPVKAAAERHCSLRKSGGERGETEEDRSREVAAIRTAKKRGKVVGNQMIPMCVDRYEDNSHPRKRNLTEGTSSTIPKIAGNVQSGNKLDVAIEADNLNLGKLLLRRSSRLQSKT